MIYRTVRDIHGRWVFISRLCPGLFGRTCLRNVSRGAMHESWQTQTALLAWSALSFCFRSSCSMPLTLSSLRTKRCSRSLHLTIGRTKSAADCGNFWRKSLAVTNIAAAWPPVNCACVLQISEQLIHITLCPGNSSINLFAVYSFKYKRFIKILFLSLNIMLIVDKHCSDVCCDKFPVPQTNRKNK